MTTALQDERFLVLDALGRGGMATVYRAFDRLDRRLVALKVQHRAAPPGPAHPMAEEFSAWARQRHANVVRAYALRHARSGPLEPDTPYLVLEHVEGRGLLDALRPGGEPPEVIESVATQLLDGLAHVHASGYVHRDLKPSNVLARAAPGAAAAAVKLTDFGLAVPAGVTPEPGRISGSLPYLPPETVLGLPLDGRADLYSLGLLLYQLAAGDLPQRPATARDWIRWHFERPPLDPRRPRPDLSPRLARLIVRLSSRRADERPADAAAALGDLGRSATAAPAVPAGQRAVLAQLRLALDAARQGAIRVFALPSCAELAAALAREAAIWTELHGLSRLAFEGADERGDSPLARPLLGLLLDRAGEAPRLVERYGLREALGLDLLGAVPVLEEPRGRPRRPPDCDKLAEFVLDCAERRPLVVELAPGALEDPAVAALRDRLAEKARANDRPRLGRGGLVLLVSPREPAKKSGEAVVPPPRSSVIQPGRKGGSAPAHHRIKSTRSSCRS